MYGGVISEQLKRDRFTDWKNIQCKKANNLLNLLHNIGMTFQPKH